MYKDAFITWNTKYVLPAMGSNTSGTDTVKSHQAIISLNINLPNNDYSLHPQISLLNLQSSFRKVAIDTMSRC